MVRVIKETKETSLKEASQDFTIMEILVAQPGRTMDYYLKAPGATNWKPLSQMKMYELLTKINVGKLSDLPKKKIFAGITLYGQL